MLSPWHRVSSITSGSYSEYYFSVGLQNTKPSQEGWAILFILRVTVSMHACMLSPFSRVQLCVTSWTVAHRLLCSWWFSRQEYWRGLPFPSPCDLPDPGIELTSLMSQHARWILHYWATKEAPLNRWGFMGKAYKKSNWLAFTIKGKILFNK